MTSEHHVRLALSPGLDAVRLHVPVLTDGSVAAWMSLRRCGDVGPSGDMQHPGKRRFLQQVQPAGKTPVGVRQVHSRRVSTVGSSGKPEFGEADGLVSAAPGLTLTVTVADCMPIVLVDCRRRVYGLLHSGWRGTGILADAVDRLVAEFGVTPAELIAVLGPCICASCYAVPAERAEYFRREFGPEAAEERSARWFLDLRQANLAIARGKGIGTVVVYDDCTACTNAFGSFRRQGSDGFTRMLVALTVDGSSERSVRQ